MHLLKLAVRPWRSSPVLQLFSASAVGIGLFSAGLAAWCGASLEPLVNRLSSEQVLTAYLDPELPQADESRVIDQIRTTLGAQAVTQPKLVRSLEFIAQVRDEYPDLAEGLEGLGSAELEAVVPRYVSASGAFQGATLDALRSVKGVVSVETSAHKMATLVGSLGAVRWIASIVAIAVLAGACALAAHVSRFNALQFGEALAFMRLMGGGAFRSRLPGIVSGVIFGLVSGIVAACSWYFGADALLARLRGMAPLLAELPSVPTIGTVYLSSGALLVGVLAGAWAGSFFGLGRERATGGRAWL